MTALHDYDRLEATALWRANAEAQRREVIVSVGKATLTISDLNDTALSHWSLAAVARVAKTKTTVTYHPEGDPGETLEFSTDEANMIAAIEKLRHVIDRRRPRPGRLRQGLWASGTLVLLGLAVFWLPDALRGQTAQMLPELQRNTMGDDLIEEIAQITGAPCANPASLAALARFSERLLGRADGVIVLPGGPARTVHVPGGRILIQHSLIEDHDTPDVAAGYVVAEVVRQENRDPVRDLLDFAGLWPSLQLLTQGAMPRPVLADYAEHIMRAPITPIETETLLAGFARAQLSSAPYAYARDITGETTLDLIEADPMKQTAPPPVLGDGDWIRLQGICGA